MTGASRNLGRIDSCKREQRDAGMLQVVRAKRVQSRCEYGASPGMRPPVVGEERTLAARTKDVLGTRLAFKVSTQLIKNRGGQRHGPSTGFRFRRSLDRSSESLHGVVLDSNRARVEVDVGPPQPRCLADPQC